MLKEQFYRLFKKLTNRSDIYIISKEQDDFVKNIALDIREHQSQNVTHNALRLLYIPSYYQIVFTRMFDILMAFAFMARDITIIPVLTGDFYDHEDVIFGGLYNQDRQKQIKAYNAVENEIWCELLKTHPVHLKDFRDQNSIDLSQEIVSNLTVENYRTFSYKEYPVGKQAEIVTANLNNMPEGIYHERYFYQIQIHMKNIIQLIETYEHIFNTILPDVVFSNVPFYYKWGSAYQIAQNQQIPFYCAMLGERSNTFFFSHNPSALCDCSLAWESFNHKVPDRDAAAHIEEAITKRIAGKNSHLSLLPEEQKTLNEQLLLDLHISTNQPIVFFPVNVLFDAVVFQKCYAFANLIEMILKVIDFFNDHPECLLILKAHPAEKLFPTHNQYCLKNVLRLFKKSLKNNIVFLDYDTTISTYDIIPLIDLGMVYTSSTAMEMAWVGKPVIALADAHYQNKGFCYQPKSEEEFFTLINKILTNPEAPHLATERIRLSKKYYWFYSQYAQIDFKMLQGSDTGVVEDMFVFESFKDLLPGRYDALDYVCSAIINQLPIYGENRWPPTTE